jgi:hypothetical protein
MSVTEAPVVAWWWSWPASLPNTRGRGEAANKLLDRAGVLPACRHVLIGGSGQPTAGQVAPFALVCVHCPAEGLRCRDCHNAHVEGDQAPHTETAEHTCDECSAVVKWISPFALLLNLTPPHLLRVRGLDGRKRAIVAPVGICGFGLCRRCRRRAFP